MFIGCFWRIFSHASAPFREDGHQAHIDLCFLEWSSWIVHWNESFADYLLGIVGKPELRLAARAAGSACSAPQN
jgi:hypothetical protein